jgi:twinkle protein
VAEFIRHLSCHTCGSSDANCEYTDNFYCFSCGTNVKKNTDELAIVKEETRGEWMMDGMVYTAIPKRGLTKESCEFWGYGVVNGESPKQIAQYFTNDKKFVCSKVRTPDKHFSVIGNAKNPPLYGQWLWKIGDSARRITICEGELDAISISQINDHKYPVVSVPHGAQSAKKALQQHYEWLDKFETIVFCFDNDDPGRKAAKDCAALFGAKSRICELPLKDANDMLTNGRGAELVKLQWNATPFRPDSLVMGGELLPDILSYGKGESFDLPWVGLQNKLKGIRKNEVLTIVAGTGSGKSQICREIAHHLMTQDLKVGYIALEETPARTMLGLMSILANEPLHVGEHSPDKLTKYFKELVQTDSVVLYDHWGSMASENLTDQIRYMVKSLEVDFVILDHLSIVVSGQDTGDERRNIDNTMTMLRTVTQELGCGMVLVNHLRRPQGDKGYEDGLQPTLSAVRGSAAIAQLSDALVATSRDQQGEDPHRSELRVLKNRFTGDTGVACDLVYNPDTGRMLEDSLGDF